MFYTKIVLENYDTEKGKGNKYTRNSEKIGFYLVSTFPFTEINTCSKSTIKTPVKGVKKIHSNLTKKSPERRH